MINMFKKSEKGIYKTEDGESYHCIVINNDGAVINKSKKDGWRPTLKAALSVTSKPADKAEA